MWEATGGEENKPVPLKTICSFKRMRRFQPYASVVAALRESTILDVVGEEGAETLRRKNPYKSSSERKRQQEANTLYVKGFGDEVATTQFDIEAFFARHGPVNYLKLRRTPERLFKGSVFVEFPDTDAARKFAESAPKWDGHDLKIMTKHEYCEEKSQLIREGKIQPSSSSRAFFEGREGPSKRGGRGGFQKNGGDKRGGHGGRGGGFRGRGGGRGRGRGRGRGGRGGRDDRGDRSEEAPKETSNNECVAPILSLSPSPSHVLTLHSSVKPRINAGEPPKDAGANGKRAREDDGGATAPPAKKVDVES